MSRRQTRARPAKASPLLVEMNRARELAAEAEALHAQGQWTGVVTRSYGAMFHLARALVYGGNFAPAEQTRELRNLERLPEEAATVAYNEDWAKLSRDQLAAFRSAVERRLKDQL